MRKRLIDEIGEQIYEKLYCMSITFVLLDLFFKFTNVQILNFYYQIIQNIKNADIPIFNEENIDKENIDKQNIIKEIILNNLCSDNHTKIFTIEELKVELNKLFA
jgi:hypothetical protein